MEVRDPKDKTFLGWHQGQVERNKSKEHPNQIEIVQDFMCSCSPVWLDALHPYQRRDLRMLLEVGPPALTLGSESSHFAITFGWSPLRPVEHWL
ncbi:hypothetical protein ACS0TY_010474 [Phlomoides rotata]